MILRQWVTSQWVFELTGTSEMSQLTTSFPVLGNAFMWVGVNLSLNNSQLGPSLLVLVSTVLQYPCVDLSCDICTSDRLIHALRGSRCIACPSSVQTLLWIYNNKYHDPWPIRGCLNRATNFLASRHVVLVKRSGWNFLWIIIIIKKIVVACLDILRHVASRSLQISTNKCFVFSM